MILTREQIAAVDDLKIEHVPVPEWGPDAEVLMKTMSGTERALFEDAIVTEGPDGVLLFRTAEEVSQLMAKNGTILLRLSGIAARLNGLSKEAQEAITKNSESAPNGASSSDLP
jgi:hypothetical protein